MWICVTVGVYFSHTPKDYQLVYEYYNLNIIFFSHFTYLIYWIFLYVLEWNRAREKTLSARKVENKKE